MDRILDKLKTVWRPEDHAGVKSFKEDQLKKDAFDTKNLGESAWHYSLDGYIYSTCVVKILRC